MQSLSPESVSALFPRLYSHGRLEQWRSLFHEQAVNIRVETVAHPPVSFSGLDAMMAEQQEYVAANRHVEESWDNIEIHQFGNIAVVKADYTLEVDRETRKGVDVLTLVRTGGRWQIAVLAYEQLALVET